MRLRLVLALFFQCLMMPDTSPGADHVWLIGGGPDVVGTQVQIERNVLWALAALARLPGSRETHVYFTDGSDPAPDLTEWMPPEESAAMLQPLARVFDSHWSNGESYRNHRISQVAGPAQALFLTEALLGQWRALLPSDRGWLIFNGHGSYDEQHNNRIELWGGTSLSVHDLQVLLNQAPQDTQLRFLFTQCYAGGFAALAKAGTNRCGFLAVAADREAEGCSAAMAESGYQDYSTHFFAALAGHTREGVPLESSPDQNGDGLVSPLEAHFYTLVKAFSADIPRATSELVLEQWQPWYLPALGPWLGEGDPEYVSLAKTLMGEAGLVPGQDLEARLVQRRELLDNQRQRLEREQAQHKEEVTRLREALEAEVLRRWPRGNAAYTRNFQAFLDKDLPQVQAFILEHPDYAELRQWQDAYWALEERRLELARTHARLEKISHLLELAHKKWLLEHLGPTSLWARYQALRACEAAPF